MIPVSRLQGEGAKAFEAFRTYCDLGEKRTHSAVAKRYSKSVFLIRKWSRAFKWKDRLRTWQLEELERAREADAQAKLEHARELERRRAVVTKNAWELYEKFVDVINEHLDLSTHASKPSDASRLAQTASLLGAIGAGEQPSRVLLSGRLGPGNPVPTAQPIINVIHQYDKRTVEARKLFGPVRPPGRAD